MKNQNGFSILEAFLIIIIIGVVIGTGWYVWQAKNNSDKYLTSNNSSTPTFKNGNQKDNPTVQIPRDWQWFNSVDKSVKFAYPKSWGTLGESASNEGGTGGSGRFVGDVVITKKKDFLFKAPTGYFNTVWNQWDTVTNSMTEATDQQAPSLDSDTTYAKPVSLGAKQSVKPLQDVDAPTGHAVYDILGKGAENCGGHYFFFDIKDYVIELPTSLCERGGPFQPQNGQGYYDNVRVPLQSFYKYIRV